MAMGTTGTVNITPEMITAALNAVEEYESTVQGLYSRLDTVVNNLIPGSFSGSAANGFQTFYTNSIEPVVSTSDQNSAIMGIIKLLKDILEGINNAIPKDTDGLDDQLGTQNGSSAESN
jgi:uncharacterized protein YukE